MKSSRRAMEPEQEIASNDGLEPFEAVQDRSVRLIPKLYPTRSRKNTLDKAREKRIRKESYARTEVTSLGHADNSRLRSYLVVSGLSRRDKQSVSREIPLQKR